MSKRENEFKEIDKFLEWYKSKRPQTVYLVKNKTRYDEVMDAIKTIGDFATASDPTHSVIIKVEPDALLGTSINFEILGNMVVFEEMKKFCSALSKADVFEVYARTDGRIGMGITFQKVYELAEPRN